jgi:chemotaxis receptor (MCP) glutamine deamidase CheD
VGWEVIFNRSNQPFKHVRQTFEEIISSNGLAIRAREVGGLNSRTLRFDLATGNVTIHSPGNAIRYL